MPKPLPHPTYRVHIRPHGGPERAIELPRTTHANRGALRVAKSWAADVGVRGQLVLERRAVSPVVGMWQPFRTCEVRNGEAGPWK